MKTARKVAVIALVHFALSAAVFITVFHMGMSRFDTGADATWLERGLVVVQEVLYFPVVTLYLRVPLAARLFPEMNLIPFLGWIPFFVNSVLWGLLLPYVSEFPFRRRSIVSCDKPTSGEFVGE